MMKWPGFFISFEGGDGSGKTTLIDQIEATLRHKQVPHLRTREPGGTVLGEQVRHLVLHSSTLIVPEAELGLFLAARAQHIHERILPALRLGKVVLCDRFNDSTVAYQAFGRGLELERVQRLCEMFCEGVVPQLTFYLDIDPKLGLERAKRASGGMDNIEAEQLDYHLKVREGFLYIAAHEPQRVRVIDASQPVDRVFQEVQNYLQRALS